ncbi:MAG: helicase-related protein [Anaerolineaceae bacterium]|nr:helicase-related protein [Anaerolineaceae bacterium]
MNLEDLRADMRVRGLTANEIVTILHVKLKGRVGAEITYLRQDSHLPIKRTVFREEESQLECISGRLYDFNANAELFRLASDAWRIKHAHVFDPFQAVHSSHIQPLPHQIDAVYNHMLRQLPLRFLLADDPGAGKTIMAGLLIRELESRGAISRCMICVPGNLAFQWQEELSEKFSLDFRIFTNSSADELTANNFLIARMDQIKRESYREMLRETAWDLVIVDEAHKMSAPWFGKTPNYTQRYQLGQLLGERTSNLLLLTATPHNGRNDEFQLFLRLLDPDRFSDRKFDFENQRIDAGDEGDPLEISDLMRRVQKEELRNFDGSKLFPDRFAYTRDFDLADQGQDLYESVTNYVRNEFNRAQQLQGGRRNSVGFAMIIMQRRLASSPKAIANTLSRRHERLRNLLEEWISSGEFSNSELPADEEERLEDLDDGHLQDPEEEEEKLVNNATNATSIDELKKEISVLRSLEVQAVAVNDSGQDSKWDDLEALLGHEDLLKDKDGNSRKLIIFTDFRDTLEYLVDRLRSFAGQPNAIVQIHGGISFPQRREVQERFWSDDAIRFLVATDAAGEGINLHCTNLMINYDLPWNPNRLEQRFGRIHRIGQRKPCYLWNLLASSTREGQVYRTLIEKMSNIHGALDGKVFDTLGDLFREKSLQEIMMEAISKPEHILPLPNQEMIREIAGKELSKIDNRLVTTTLEENKIHEMDILRTRALAASLQPWHIKAFFARVLKLWGASLHRQGRKDGVFGINHVPIQISARIQASEQRFLSSVDMLCFEPQRYREFRASGVQLIDSIHPLLQASVKSLLATNDRWLNKGAILIDGDNICLKPRLLVYLEQSIICGQQDSKGHPIELERGAWCVEICKDEEVIFPDDAPWIDYREALPAEESAVKKLLMEHWLDHQDYFIGLAEEELALSKIKPRWEEVSGARREKIQRDRNIISTHLQNEIANQSRVIGQEHNREQVAMLAGTPQEVGSARRRRRLAEERKVHFEEQLNKRMSSFDLDADIRLGGSHVAGVALVFPVALLSDKDRADAVARREIELAAMKAIMEAERELGNEPQDVSASKRGYDIESVPKGHGPLRLIEVKGRRADAGEVTLTRNELLTSLNCSRNEREVHILAIVRVNKSGEAEPPHYLFNHMFAEPDPAASSVNFKLSQLLENSESPR